MREAFLIHMGSAREVIEKKGYFKAYEENNKAYVELCGKIKSAKAQLATLDESAIGETGTSKKSKKTQEAAAVNDQVTPALQAKIEADVSAAQEAAVEAKKQGWNSCQWHVPAVRKFVVHWRQIHLEQNCTQVDRLRPIYRPTRLY